MKKEIIEAVWWCYDFLNNNNGVFSLMTIKAKYPKGK